MHTVTGFLSSEVNGPEKHEEETNGDVEGASAKGAADGECEGATDVTEEDGDWEDG